MWSAKCVLFMDLRTEIEFLYEEEMSLNILIRRSDVGGFYKLLDHFSTKKCQKFLISCLNISSSLELFCFYWMPGEPKPCNEIFNRKIAWKPPETDKKTSFWSYFTILIQISANRSSLFLVCQVSKTTTLTLN